MEKLCSIKGSKLYFNGEELLKIESIEKIEVKTLPVRQAIKSQLLNSMATFMSGSLINGNEQCIVGLSIPWWRSHPIHENRATESIWTEPCNPLLRATKSTKRATSA